MFVKKKKKTKNIFVKVITVVININGQLLRLFFLTNITHL